MDDLQCIFGSWEVEGLGGIGQWFVKTFDPNEQRERDNAKTTQNGTWVVLANKFQERANIHKREVDKADLACITEIYELEKQLADLTKQPPPEYPEGLKIQARQKAIREATLNTNDVLELSTLNISV